jgi:DNA-binding NarL/FixJ family response regulator
VSIRVGIADDQSLVRDGFRVQLGLVPDITFVGEASNGLQALVLARQQRPDVLLMDVRMPEMDGIEATRRITTDPATAGVRVLVLTTFDLDEHVYAALAAGASGFLVKDVTPEDLVKAIRVVAAGESLLAPSVTSLLVREFARRPTAGRPRPDALADLTEREREVLVLVAQGLSNAEIAGRLFISEGTLKSHVNHLLAKIDARDRAQAVAYAYRHGPVEGS